jgi:hypothetical protein
MGNNVHPSQSIWISESTPTKIIEKNCCFQAPMHEWQHSKDECEEWKVQEGRDFHTVDLELQVVVTSLDS